MIPKDIFPGLTPGLEYLITFGSGHRCESDKVGARPCNHTISICASLTWAQIVLFVEMYFLLEEMTLEKCFARVSNFEYFGGTGL